MFYGVKYKKYGYLATHSVAYAKPVSYSFWCLV